VSVLPPLTTRPLRTFVAAYPGHELASPARRAVVDTYLKQGKKAELTEEYKKLMAQSPAAADALYDAGVIAQRLGRGRDANAAWARLRKEFPEHALSARASLDLAQAAFGKNAFKDAATLARVASKSSEEPVRAEALVLLGESELKLRRYTAALQAFQTAAAAPGQDPSAADGGHARAKAVPTLADEFAGLVGALRGHWGPLV